MQTEQLRIAILGAGNMGGAMARALAKSGMVPEGNIRVSNPSPAKLEALKAAFPDMYVSSSNMEVSADADVVIVAVKPWLVRMVLAEVAGQLKDDAIVVSVAAGVTLAQLDEYAGGGGRPTFRVIPNTAIEVGQGVSAVSAQHETDEQRQCIMGLFDTMGATFFVPEDRLNAYMSLASCGIAYAFRYIRAAMEGGVEMGIRPDEAKRVVMQTLRGAVAVLEANGTHPEAEVDRVTTPGGITIRGLNEMEANGFTNAVIKGLKASNG